MSDASDNVIVCPVCALRNCFIHRTGNELVLYCGNCGYEQRETRNPPRVRWTNAERAAKERALPNKKKSEIGRASRRFRQLKP